MKKYIGCIIATITVCAFTACVGQVATEADDGRVIPCEANATPETLSSTPAPTGELDCFTRAQVDTEDYFDGRLRVNFKTEIDIPPQCTFRVRKAVRRPLTNTQLVSFIRLIGSMDMLYNESGKDKGYWEKELQIAQSGRPDGKGNTAIDDVWLAYCQEQYQNAPSAIERTSFDISGITPGNRFTCDVVFDETKIGLIGANENPAFYFMRDRDIVSNINAYTVESNDMVMPEVEISAEEAIVVADSVVAALEANDLVLDSVEERAVTSEQGKPLIGVQCAVYVRCCDGLTAYDMGKSFIITPRNLPDYGSPWPQERLEVCVDGSGIVSVFWDGMTEVTSEWMPASIMPFSQLQPIVFSRLAQLSASAVVPEWFCAVNITQWKLGLSITSAENDREAGALIPTWYLTYQETAGLRSDERTSRMDVTRMIAFSALNGDYIEPRMTNEMIAKHSRHTK